MERQEFWDPPHQLQRIVAIKETSGLWLVSQREQFGRRLADIARQRSTLGFDQPADPIRQDSTGRSELRIGALAGYEAAKVPGHRTGIVSGLGRRV